MLEMDFILPLLGFISGGGISTVIAIKYTKKNNKLDYADKAVKFMEDVQDKMNVRIHDLEIRIETLEEISCIQVNCVDRNNPYKKIK